MSLTILRRNIARRGKVIEISDRKVSIFNGDPSEVFSNKINVKAITKTLRGITVFDGTNTERIATHKIIIEYIDGLTSEKWIKLNGKRIKILTVENCCECNLVHVLMCTDRGEDSKVVNDG